MNKIGQNLTAFLRYEPVTTIPWTEHKIRGRFILPILVIVVLVLTTILSFIITDIIISFFISMTICFTLAYLYSDVDRKTGISRLEKEYYKRKKFKKIEVDEIFYYLKGKYFVKPLKIYTLK